MLILVMNVPCTGGYCGPTLQEITRWGKEIFQWVSATVRFHVEGMQTCEKQTSTQVLHDFLEVFYAKPCFWDAFAMPLPVFIKGVSP